MALSFSKMSLRWNESTVLSPPHNMQNIIYFLHNAEWPIYFFPPLLWRDLILNGDGDKQSQPSKVFLLSLRILRLPNVPQLVYLVELFGLDLPEMRKHILPTDIGAHLNQRRVLLVLCLHSTTSCFQTYPKRRCVTRSRIAWFADEHKKNHAAADQISITEFVYSPFKAFHDCILWQWAPQINYAVWRNVSFCLSWISPLQLQWMNPRF